MNNEKQCILCGDIAPTFFFDGVGEICDECYYEIMEGLGKNDNELD